MEAALILFVLLYSWMAFNVISISARRLQQFSLRTLLITVTIVSMELGLAVHVLRK